MTFTTTCYDLEDCIIVVKNTILDLDRNEDDVIEVTYDIEFVTLDDLKEMDTIFNSTEENDDWYYSDFKYDAKNELFYVEVYRVTEECQDALETAKFEAIETLKDNIANAGWDWNEAEMEIAEDAINAVTDITKTTDDLIQVGIEAVRASRP